MQLERITHRVNLISNLIKKYICKDVNNLQACKMTLKLVLLKGNLNL